MTLTQTHHLCVRKTSVSNYFNFSINLISHIAQLHLIRKFYCFRKDRHIYCKYGRHNHLRCRWWEKYLSKCSPLKHTCSWHDKLIVLWILNRQAKYLYVYNNHYLKQSCIVISWCFWKVYWHMLKIWAWSVSLFQRFWTELG